VSPLAGRPYDLRHAALTTWLNVEVSPADVSKRADNSIEVLLRRHAAASTTKKKQSTAASNTPCTR